MTVSEYPVELKPEALRNLERRQGISVIVPTCNGVESLRTALSSVVSQTIDHALVEVVVIENGCKGGARDLVRSLRQTCGCDGGTRCSIDWIFIESELAGAGIARNIGLLATTRQYVTFLDDDDSIEPRYLEALYENAKPHVVAVTGIADVTPDGFDIRDTLLNERIEALPATPVPISAHPWLLGFNACKLISWDLLGTARYDEQLKSGEDVVFYANLLKNSGLEVVRVRKTDGARYRRGLREDSLSRREDSFGFSVLERLDSIRALQTIQVPPKNAAAKSSLIRSQASFIVRYNNNLDDPREQSAVADAVALSAAVDFPWEQLRRPSPTTLVFSFCFPPYSDTSGNVMAKRILLRREMVDVVSNDMSNIRLTDYRFYSVVRRWIDKHFILDSYNSFSNWDAILEWAEIANEKVRDSGRKYDAIYSRAFWVQSHLAAALYKLRNPNCSWTAEFSDPLVRAIDGSTRPGPLASDEVVSLLMQATGIDQTPDNLFSFIEEVTLRLADELVFINEVQADVVLDGYDLRLKDSVRERMTIAPQPTPSPELYRVADPAYPMTRSRINIGYFGAVYPNRGIDNILKAVASLDEQEQAQVAIHIFTKNPDTLRHGGLNSGTIRLNGYVPYLDFLALADRMDVLIVNDTEAAEGFGRNPFLPSKLSDYRGANARIWGITEDDSPLSATLLHYRTPKDSKEEIVKTLKEIITDLVRKEVL